MAEKKNDGIYLNNAHVFKDEWKKTDANGEEKSGTVNHVPVTINGRKGRLTVPDSSLHEHGSKTNVWLSNDPNYELDVYFSDTKKNEKFTAQAIYDAYEAGWAKFKAGEKTAPAKAEAPAPAKEEKKNDTIWLNNVSIKNVNEAHTKNGLRQSIHFGYEGHLASFLVSPGQVRPGKNDHLRNILVGSPNQKISCSYPDGKGGYERFDMTAQEIIDSDAKSREEYQKSKEAEKTEDR